MKKANLLLKDATLEEIDAEIRKTSTCVVVDADEIKEAGNWIEIRDGEIVTFFEDVSGKAHKIRRSLSGFVLQNILAARQCDTRAQFIIDARALARQLERAADRLELEL